MVKRNFFIIIQKKKNTFKLCILKLFLLNLLEFFLIPRENNKIL
jgi:hypothetical protein